MHQQQETSKPSKAESARTNGAKSHGAVTPQGKINSANGNLKHGAYSKRVLMDGESAESYEFFKSCFVELFHPTDAFEAECVDSIVTARWRIRRLESSETTSLNHALLFNKEANAAKFDVLDVIHERGIAVQSQILFTEASTRVQERLHRISERNYKLLANYRRKSGRNMPVSEPHASTTVAQDPTAPDMEEKNKPPATANTPALTDQPTTNPPHNPPVASIITTITMFLVIFALLMLIPVTTTAKTSAIDTTASAFHVPASPADGLFGVSSDPRTKK